MHQQSRLESYNNASCCRLLLRFPRFGCDSGLSLGDKNCIKDRGGDEQWGRNCKGICILRPLKAQHLCPAHLGIREGRTLLPHRQRKGLCASRHITAELHISHFMSSSVRAKSAYINSHCPRKDCSLLFVAAVWHRKKKSFYYSSHFHFFIPLSISAAF